MISDVLRTLALFTLLIIAVTNCANAQVTPQASESVSPQTLGLGSRVSDELVAQFADPALTGCPIANGSIMFFDKGAALSIPSMFSSSDDATHDNAVDLMLAHWNDKSVTWEFVGRGKCAVEITVRLKASTGGQMSYESLRAPEAEPAH